MAGYSNAVSRLMAIEIGPMEFTEIGPMELTEMGPMLAGAAGAAKAADDSSKAREITQKDFFMRVSPPNGVRQE
jgi:hypothetical protein